MWTRVALICSHIAAFFDDARKLYEESLLPALSKEIQDDRAITRPTPKRNAWQSSHKTSPQIKPHFESLKSAQTRYKALYFGEGRCVATFQSGTGADCSPAQFAGPKEDAETEAMVWWFKTKDALAANHQSAAPTITDSIPDSGTISSFTPSQT